MRKEMGYEGSGTRAMQENLEAIAQITKEMQALTLRAESGERVDNEVTQLRNRLKILKEDQSRIESAGMV